MNCPRCGSRMAVTNTYACGEAGAFHSLKCPGCKARGVAQTVLLDVNPSWGNGAAARAKRSGADRVGQSADHGDIGIQNKV